VKIWDALVRSSEEGKTIVQALEAKADSVKGRKVEARRENPESDEEAWSSDEDVDMEGDQTNQLLVVEHPPQNHRPDPIVDEDGFTLVQGKGKRN